MPVELVSRNAIRAPNVLAPCLYWTPGVTRLERVYRYDSYLQDEILMVA